MKTIKTVPNQRVLTIHKEATDKDHKYTMNNLSAIDEAAFRLQSKGGFKLYMYLAKNQNKYSFALSSNNFCMWSRLGIGAYRTAFEELETQGYLVKKAEGSNIYTFYDKAVKDDPEAEKDSIEIEYPEEQVNKMKEFIF